MNNPDINSIMQEKAKEYASAILKRQSEIIDAFIAEHGCFPSEAVLVNGVEDGKCTFYITKRHPSKIEEQLACMTQQRDLLSKELKVFVKELRCIQDNPERYGVQLGESISKGIPALIAERDQLKARVEELEKAKQYPLAEAFQEFQKKRCAINQRAKSKSDEHDCTFFRAMDGTCFVCGNKQAKPHNPDNLDAETVGTADGWRHPLEVEVDELKEECERLNGVIKSDLKSFEFYVKKHVKETETLKAELAEAVTEREQLKSLWAKLGDSCLDFNRENDQLKARVEELQAEVARSQWSAADRTALIAERDKLRLELEKWRIKPAHHIPGVTKMVTKPISLPKPHNPDNLDAETVGTADGWRLLDEDEAIQQWSVRGVECFRHGFAENDASWYPHMGALFSGNTYRTELTREELRKARGLE